MTQRISRSASKASIELSRNTDTKWSVGHVNADTSIADRNAELKQMADRRTNLKEKARGLVTNVRALGEGINAEDINLVVLDVNMRSAVSLGQAAGRATRIEDANPQKKVGYVLVLVMLAERDVADLRHDIDDCESQPDPSTSTNRTPRDAPRSTSARTARLEHHIDRLRRCGWKISNKVESKRFHAKQGIIRDQHLGWSSTPIKVTLQEAILLQNELDARGENPDSNAMRDDDDDKEDDEKTFTRTRGTTTNSLSTLNTSNLCCALLPRRTQTCRSRSTTRALGDWATERTRERPESPLSVRGGARRDTLRRRVE